MTWFNEYQLFLFDLDGLLVNTEYFHYRAYQQMCEERGFVLDWDFSRYCQVAHYEAEGLKEQIYRKFPGLVEMEPNWEVLYLEKKRALVALFEKEPILLMPGVEELLKRLDELGKQRAVVTHSSGELIELIRRQNPLLNTIPHWWTREHYTHPKPDPECYQSAIAKLAKDGDRVIGFEDTPRGLQALMGTKAQPVIVTQVPYPEILGLKKQGVFHLKSLDEIFSIA